MEERDKLLIIEAKVKEINEDIKELKENNKELIKLISKLSFFEDKFKSNDEAHKLIWEKIHIVEDEVIRNRPLLRWLNTCEENKNKVIIGVIISALSGWVLYVLSVTGVIR